MSEVVRSFNIPESVIGAMEGQRGRTGSPDHSSLVAAALRRMERMEAVDMPQTPPGKRATITVKVPQVLLSGPALDDDYVTACVLSLLRAIPSAHHPR